MIDSVSRESAVFAELPHKFEAGTVNGGGAVGLQAAIDYLMTSDLTRYRSGGAADNTCDDGDAADSGRSYPGKR